MDGNNVIPPHVEISQQLVSIGYHEVDLIFFLKYLGDFLMDCKKFGRGVHVSIRLSLKKQPLIPSCSM